MVYDYYLVFLLLLSFVGLSSLDNRNEAFRAFFVILLCSIFIGLRGGEAGSDTISYVNAYKSIDTSGFSYLELKNGFVANNVTAAEPGFILISYMFKFLGLNYSSYLTSLCFISLSLLYLGLKKITPFSLLALFLYCCSISLVSLQGNVIRQGVAIPLIIVAIGFLSQGKRRGFIFFGVIASLFHFSAIFVFFSLFLTWFSLKVRHYIYILVAYSLTFKLTH